MWQPVKATQGQIEEQVGLRGEVRQFVSTLLKGQDRFKVQFYQEKRALTFQSDQRCKLCIFII